MKPAKFTQAVVVAITIGATGPAAALGTLLADGTLDNPGDLTRVRVNGGPTILEFLDLSVTKGMTVAAAVSQFRPAGFEWAGGAQATELFSAFGIGYLNHAGAVTTMASSESQRAEFVSHLSPTSTTGSLGWVDDLTTSTFHTYLCVGPVTCNGGSAFANNSENFWPSTQITGVFLVRAVPEPSVWLLLAGGVAALSARVRRQRRRPVEAVQ